MNQINNDPFISRQIDLNLNIGQSYGDELIELDLMQYATSVNVSTGAHAGDPAYINKSLQACKDHENLSVGALISYPDLLGFGMRKIQLSNEYKRKKSTICLKNNFNKKKPVSQWEKDNTLDC